MATASDPLNANAPPQELAPYQAVSRSAVVAFILLVVSLPLVVLAVISMRYQVGDAVPLGMAGCLFAFVASVLGGTGLITIRRYPLEYTGRGLARAGLLGGITLFLIGSSVSAYTYATEVPDGYERVGFWELQPDPDRPELPIGPKALDVAGKKIFIKGYMHPGVASGGKVSHFILVPDMGTCCFGGQPKPTDMIEVVSPESERISYSTRRVKLAGTFQLFTQPTQTLGLNGVVFHLEADRVR
jgi:hypothetical protein